MWGSALFDRSRYEPKRVILATLRAMVRDLDPAVLEPAAAVALVDWFAEVERLAAAGKALAARRVADSGVWRSAGDHSAADWLAKRTGGTISDARAAIATAENVEHAPATDHALRAGALSAKQAEAVAAAARLDPAAETRLLDLANCQSLQKLRDEAARVRAAADPDPNARHDRIRRDRFWKRWTDPDGARRGSYSLTPEAAAVLEAAAQPFIDTHIDTARRTGDHEPFDAYAADGLVDMAASTMNPTAAPVPAPATTETPEPDGPGVTPAPGASDARPSEPPAPDAADADAPPARPTPPPEAATSKPARGGRGRKRLRNRRELIAIVNVESLRRGSVAPGEVCEIAGTGPVSLHAIRELFADALVRVVIRDGVDIRTVVHAGRLANALQETAILVRDNGRCRRPRCDLPISEIDHTAGYTNTRQTTLDDLVGLCGHCHDLKTRHGHTYRVNEHGHLEWTRPDGTIEYERPPP